MAFVCLALRTEQQLILKHVPGQNSEGCIVSTVCWTSAHWFEDYHSTPSPGRRPNVKSSGQDAAGMMWVATAGVAKVYICPLTGVGGLTWPHEKHDTKQ